MINIIVNILNVFLNIEYCDKEFYNLINSIHKCYNTNFLISQRKRYQFTNKIIELKIKCKLLKNIEIGDKCKINIKINGIEKKGFTMQLLDIIE